jgi:hypothetical protein
VAGEEEGLYGSEHFAPDAKTHGMDTQGMLDNDQRPPRLGAERTPAARFGPRVVDRRIAMKARA